MNETIRNALDALMERPARVGIAGLIAGIGIGLAIPHLLPYWRLFAFIGIMSAFVRFEFRRK